MVLRFKHVQNSGNSVNISRYRLFDGLGRRKCENICDSAFDPRFTSNTSCSEFLNVVLDKGPFLDTVGAVGVWLLYEVITFPHIWNLRTENPTTTSLIEYRISQAKADGAGAEEVHDLDAYRTDLAQPAKGGTRRRRHYIFSNIKVLTGTPSKRPGTTA